MTFTGENLLTGNGTVSHLQAMEKAQTEYKKYKAKTLSSVEKDYLESNQNAGAKRETAEISYSKISNNSSQLMKATKKEFFAVASYPTF